MSILDTPEDFELCDSVFCALADEAINVDACDELERIIRLMWDSLGLVGNGGLHRLFEDDYPGDPGFVYTIAAYHRIDTQNAYEALRAAIKQFPGGVLPVNIEDRLRIFESLPKQIWDELEARYYRAQKETKRCMTRFIREHRNGYQQLLLQT